MSTLQNKRFDAVIMGGGLAGLTLAIQLRKRVPDITIAIVERNRHPVPEAAHKVGESSVELASFYFAEVLGLKDHMVNQQLPKLGLRYFFNIKDDVKTNSGLHDYMELGGVNFPVSPSFQIDRGIFENFLAEHCKAIGVTFFDGTKVRDIQIMPDKEEHTIFCENVHSKVKMDLSCRWMVDATSRISLIKKKLGLKQDSPHKVSAAWFRVDDRVDITDWSDSQQWKSHNVGKTARWYSTNHIMGPGFWVWIIPLSSGSTSIGIVADNNFHPLNTYNTIEKAMIWLETHAPVAAKNIRPYLSKLQDYKFLLNFSHGSKQVYSKDRWFMTGEAGTFLDPFYSPGSDMIAISNTFVTNLIEADHKSQNLDHMASTLNRFYLSIHEQTLGIYTDKYQMFGNPVVMPVKFVWDNVVYFSLTAYLFIQGKFNDVENELFKYLEHFQEVGELNVKMHEFLVAWNQCEIPKCSNIYIEPGKLCSFDSLNEALYKMVPDEVLGERLKESVVAIRKLYHEIIAAAISQSPELEAKYGNEIATVVTTKNDVSELLNAITKGQGEKVMA